MIEAYKANRRRDILRILYSEMNYKMSIDNIKTILQIHYAYAVNRDEIKEDIEFLEEKSAIKVINAEPLIIELTYKGTEAMENVRMIDGVARLPARS